MDRLLKFAFSCCYVSLMLSASQSYAWVYDRFECTYDIKLYVHGNLHLEESGQEMFTTRRTHDAYSEEFINNEGEFFLTGEDIHTIDDLENGNLIQIRLRSRFHLKTSFQNSVDKQDIDITVGYAIGPSSTSGLILPDYEEERWIDVPKGEMFNVSDPDLVHRNSGTLMGIRKDFLVSCEHKATFKNF